jgi:hypothetical protein
MSRFQKSSKFSKIDKLWQNNKARQLDGSSDIALNKENSDFFATT